MKTRFKTQVLIILATLQACTDIRSEDMVATWSINQWVEDGIDKTDQLASQPWGTSLQLAKDGSFRTNGRANNQGSWKINQGGSTIYVRFPSDSGQYTPWKVLLSGDYLVLKATTQQLYLSRTDTFTTLPPVTVDLRNNLPGIWYFYQMKTDSSLVRYPQQKRRARWLQIDKGGSYKSGEGKSTPLRGRWILQHDTLTFSDFNRPWKKSWVINIDDDGVLYFRTLAEDSTSLEQVSFVNEANLP